MNSLRPPLADLPPGLWAYCYDGLRPIVGYSRSSRLRACHTVDRCRTTSATAGSVRRTPPPPQRRNGGNRHHLAGLLAASSPGSIAASPVSSHPRLEGPPLHGSLKSGTSFGEARPQRCSGRADERSSSGVRLGSVMHAVLLGMQPCRSSAARLPEGPADVRRATGPSWSPTRSP